MIPEQSPADSRLLAEYRALFEAMDVGYCIIEVLFDAQEQLYDYRFLSSNPAFEQHSGLVNVLGKTARELVPTLDDFWFQTYGDVARTGEPVRFQSHAPAMGRWFEVNALRVGDPVDCRVGVLFTDISTRKATQEALQESEERLRSTQTRLESALTAGAIGTWAVDLVTNGVAGDANIARLFSMDPEVTVAGNVPAQLFWDAIHKEDLVRVTQKFAEALADGDDYEDEYRVMQPDGTHRWVAPRGKIQRDANGVPVSLFGVVADISGRIERDRTERFLADVTSQMRALLDPEEVLYETAKAVGQYLNTHRCLYIEVDDDADTLTIRRDFVQGEGVASIAGTFPLDSFGPPIIESLRNGNITRSDDTETDPRLQPEHRATFRATNFRAFLGVPLHRAGKWVAILAVHYAEPRVWTKEEANLLATVAERTWLAVENARLFRETKQRAEREALLNQISAAVRESTDPDAILQTAVRLLGEGIGADRCYVVRYSPARDTAQVSHEWLRDGIDLTPLAGRTFEMATYGMARNLSSVIGKAQVINDLGVFAPEDAAPILAASVRSLIRVLIEIGGQTVAIAVIMASEPREWTDDEANLVENVATLARFTLESASARERERNIAQQLQAALLPETPTSLPGLALASFYRPALDEAGVGGDFFDVFEVKEGCTALVVADVSGKGLAAAQQVATIRNMLRFALYGNTKLSEAVNNLHHALLTHNLLTGFATLFVGLYDHTERTITYANCGQESGLLLRSNTGEVEQLRTTGALLGGFDTGQPVEQETVSLSTGDVLALLTDGLTEVGPNRKELLEIEGVSRLLHDCYVGAPAGDPDYVVDRLIAAVDGYGRGGSPDDIALLVGIVV